MRKRRRVYYWHHSPRGWWWKGAKMATMEDGGSSSSKTFYTKDAGIRSLCKWGGVLVRMIPTKGGVFTPMEWGDWDDDGSKAARHASRS